MSALRWIAALLLVAAVLWIRAVPRVLQESALTPPPANTADDVTAIVSRFGAPDADTTTAGPDSESTRTLTYGSLRILFVQRTFGSVRVWKRLGFFDPVTRASVSGDEALQRLLARATAARGRR